jgi:hypothetical protein
VLPQPVQKRETLGGEAGPPERRGWYAPSRDCTVFRGNYCLTTENTEITERIPRRSPTDVHSDPESFDPLRQLPDVEIDHETNRAAGELEV